MTKSTTRRRAAAILATFLLANASTAGPRPAAWEPSDSGTDSVIETLVGTGPGETTVCILCGAGILIGGGASLVGLFFLTMAAPEAVVLCGYTCWQAFG